MKISQDKLVAEICLLSFYEFVKEFWDEIISETPVWNWHVKILCDVMQEKADTLFRGEDKTSDVIINIPPGTTKSTICSVMFPAWCYARNPATRIISGSHTDTLVMDLSTKTRTIVKSEKYQRYFGIYSDRPDRNTHRPITDAPIATRQGRAVGNSRHRKNKSKVIYNRKLFPGKVVLREDQDTKSYWATTNGGFRFSCTAGGKTPTGFHAHFIIADDPIDPQRVFSEKEIVSVNDWMRNVISSRKVDSRKTVTFLIMQRLHQNDPAGNWLADEEMRDQITHICLPAEDSELVYPKELRKFYVDGLLDPVRLPKSVLSQKLRLMGQFGYSGQYAQNPIPLGGGMFKTERLQFGLPPTEWKMVARFWDKAATKGGLGAFSAGVKMGLDMQGRFWVLNVKRGRWDSYAREEEMRQTAIVDSRKTVIGLEQEPGSGGVDSTKASVRNLAGFVVRWIRPTGDKALRADPFSVQVNAGNVWLPDPMIAGTLWQTDYIDELRNFPNSTYKDQTDASAGAFNLLTSPIVIGAV